MDYNFIKSISKETKKELDGLYTIKDISRMVGVSPFTLRYWDKVFSEILIPIRTSGGQRRYDRNLLNTVREIYQLVRVEGYSIRGARRILSGKAKSDSIS